MNMDMNRRDFLVTSAVVGASLPLATNLFAESESGGSERFRLNYAPHFGMFQHSAGEELVEQVRFMAEHGFSALEDSLLRKRSQEQQRLIRREMDRRGMRFGLFAGSVEFGSATFASGRADLRAKLLEEIRASALLAQRMNAVGFSLVPGKVDSRLSRSVQTANVLETLKRAAEICEQVGVVMLLDPVKQGDLFLQRLPQAAIVCRQIDSPACRVLFDVYEQSEQFPDVIAAIDRYRDVIGYFQVGDNPGRKEPGTGSLPYRDLFGYLSASGYSGVIGMDHGNSLPGERGELAVVEAYCRV